MKENLGVPSDVRVSRCWILILRQAVRARRADHGAAGARLTSYTSLARGDLMVGCFHVLSASASLAITSCAIVPLTRHALGVDKTSRRRFQEKDEGMEEEQASPGEGRQERTPSEP